MYKLFTIFSTSPLLQGHAGNQSILAFMKGLPRLIKAVNRRALSTIGTTLMLSALLSACGGGGGSTSTTSSTAPTTSTITAPTPILTTPTFSISSSSLSIDENFATPQLVATVSDATAITVSQSNPGVVTVTTSNTQVNVLSIANVTGRTTLTITATNGSLSATTQVTVTVNAVNGPTTSSTPTFIVLSSNLSFDEDFTGSWTVATVSNATSITVNQSNLGVVTVTNSNTQVNVSRIPNATGRTVLTISATNGSFTATTQVTVTVNPVNNTPTPTFTVSSSNFSIDEDFATSQLVASVSDATAITVSQSNPGVVTVTNTSSQVNVSSMLNANGRTILTITATNGTLSATTQVTVIVNAVNDQPTLTVSTTALTLDEDFGTVLIATTRTDVDNNTLTFTVVESTTGVVTVTVTDAGVSVSNIRNANGQTTLSITLSDGRLSTITQVVVDVTPINDPPALTVSTNALTLAEDFRTVLIATTRTDIDSTSLTFTVAESTTGVVTVTVTDADVSVSSIRHANGQTTLTITLSDGRLSTITQVVIDVTAINDTPTLTVSTNALILAEDFGTLLIATTRSDVDSNTLTLTVTESATGVVTVQTSTSGVSVSSIAHRSGRTTLTITLSDSQLTSTTQVLVTVNAVNDTPTLTVSSNSITTLSAFSTMTINTTASDIEDTTLSFTVSESTPGVVIVTTSANAITLIPNAAATGQTILTVRVVDSSGTIVTQTISVNVLNRAPGFLIFTNRISVLEDFEASLFVAFVIDVEDTVTISVSSTTHLVDVVTSTPSQFVSINLSAIENANGTTTLTIQAIDTVGQSATTEVVVVVAPVNDTPTLTVSTTALTLAEGFRTVLIATTRTDIDSNSLTLTVTESATGVVTVTTTDAGVQIANIPNANGQTTLTITLSDSRLSTTTQVVVDVTANNDPPVLTVSTTALTLAEDFGAVLIATSRTDIDSTTLTLTVSESTTGVVTVMVTDTGVQVVNIPNANGQTTLTITLSDGRLNATTQVVVVVTPVNDPPSLTVSTTALTLAEDFGAVLIATSRTDIDSTTLTLTVSESTTGVVSVTTTDAGVRVVNIPNANGQTTLTITLSDSRLSTTTQVVVTVNAVNDTPTITVSSNVITIGSVPVVLAVTASDVEDLSLAFSVSTGQGVVNTTAISAIRFTITRLDFSPNAPQILLTLRTTDTNNASTFTIVTVVPTPLFNVTTGIKTLDFAWTAVPNADNYRLQSAPAGSSYMDFSTTSVVVSPNSTNIRQTTAQALVGLHRYIPRVSGPQFGVNACTSGLCESAYIGNTVALTNAQLNSMIGRLQASNPDSVDQFGYSVSLSGDGNTLAVGATNEDGSSMGVNSVQNNSAGNSGAVYLFRRIGGAWAQQAYIKASNSEAGDQFGWSVSLSDDGNTLAVGTFREDSSSVGVNGLQNNNSAANSGAVYLFRFSTFSNAWAQQAYIKPSNTGAGDFFGWSVSLSGDGNTLAMGAWNEDGSSTGVNGAQNNNSAANSGAVYVFRFSTFSSAWAQQAYIKASNTGAGDQFGFYVSLSADGNTLAVGANGEASSSTGINGVQGDNTAISSGAVYLFRFNTISSTWSQQAYIKASNTEGFDNIGQSVSLSADGNTLAVVAINEDSSSTGVNGAQGDNTATNSGAVYLFRFSTTSNTWSQQAYIKASNTGAGDQFGRSVSLNADGNILAVGADAEDGSASGVGGVDDNGRISAGATYVFEFSNGAWAQQAYIKATDPSNSANYGFSVSLSRNGNSVAVGAYGVSNQTGAVYLY